MNICSPVHVSFSGHCVSGVRRPQVHTRRIFNGWPSLYALRGSINTASFQHVEYDSAMSLEVSALVMI